MYRTSGVRIDSAVKRLTVGLYRVLPRQIGKGGVPQSQADAKALRLSPGLLGTLPKTHRDLAAEDGREEHRAEVLGRLQLGRFGTPDRPPASADSQQEVLELHVGQGQAELRGCGASRRGQNAGAQTGPCALYEKVEIPVCHGPNAPWIPRLTLFRRANSRKSVN